MDQIPNSVSGIEYIDTLLYKGSSYAISIATLVAFIGGRHVVNDLYEHRQDIICNPIIKIIILFSIIFMSIKDVKMSIIIFFIYLFLIDNYVSEDCNKEYLNNSK